MSKTLEERLKYANTALGGIANTMTQPSGKLPAIVEEQFTTIAAFGSEVQHWQQLLAARQAARSLLNDLVTDVVPYGATQVSFQIARLLGVQAYVSTQWALADQLVRMVGRIACAPNVAFNDAKPAQLVSEFLGSDRKKNTSAVLHDSIRQTSGWPIAVSYALRNHFVHDGGQVAGVNFFAGQTPESKFEISKEGWKHIEKKATMYGVTSIDHHATATWPTDPCNNLLAVLDVCERELDEALGILVGSACHTAVGHLGFLLGEDG